jgi:hypothetical protein
MESRPLCPCSRSKIGSSNLAAFADISSTIIHAISSSVARGQLSASARMRPFQYVISCFSTVTTMEGLQVAPTAPLSIE